MTFWTLPLAFLLAAGLYSVLPVRAFLATVIRSFYNSVKKLLIRTAGEESAHLTPLLFLLFVTAIFCILGGIFEHVHPLMNALLIAPLIDFPLFSREALSVREALEDGLCTTDEELAEYEQRVMHAIGLLAEQTARNTLPLLMLCIVFTPFHLAPAAAWAFYAMRLCAAEGCSVSQKADEWLSRMGEYVLVWAILPTAALCGTELGMAYRARKQGVQPVLLNAVGVDPMLRRGHRPVTGDISQSCLCVCLAMAVIYVPVMFLMVVLGG